MTIHDWRLIGHVTNERTTVVPCNTVHHAHEHTALSTCYGIIR
jgi:hypothetical protein